MERYIFIRDWQHASNMLAEKGDILQVAELGVLLMRKNYKAPAETGMTELSDDLRIHLLPIDADLFKTAFQSFAYANWMKEKAADIDDQGNPLYPILTRTPETLIMYLMELGISSDTLMRYMYGPENKYLEYKYLVQEFGKML